MGIMNSRVAAVGVGALVVVGLGAGGAVGADLVSSEDIQDQSVRRFDIRHGAVGSSELRGGRGAAVHHGHIENNQVWWQDLGKGVQAKLNEPGPRGPQGPKGDQGAEGPRGPQGPPGASIAGHDTSAAPEGQFGVTVQHIGGQIEERKTDLAEVQLEPGTYLVSVDGAFMYPGGTQPHAAGVDLWPQLSLWVDENENGALEWNPQDGGEGSISPNALMPNVVDRHVSASGSTLLTVTEEQVAAGEDADTVPVHVSAFGYDSEQGQAGAGELQAMAELTVLEVDEG